MLLVVMHVVTISFLLWLLLEDPAEVWKQSSFPFYYPSPHACFSLFFSTYSRFLRSESSIIRTFHVYSAASTGTTSQLPFPKHSPQHSATLTRASSAFGSVQVRASGDSAPVSGVLHVCSEGWGRAVGRTPFWRCSKENNARGGCC